MYETALLSLLQSDEVDTVAPILLQRSALMPEVTDAVIAAWERARRDGVNKPVHVCWVAPQGAEANREKLLKAGIPCHAWPAATATNLAATSAHKPRPMPRAAGAHVIPAPAAADPDGWLSSNDVFQLLQEAELPVAPWAVAATAEQAVEAAEGMNYPVVLKAERPGLIHKSDVGAVRPNLLDRAAVATTFGDFCERFGPGPALVQKQATPGTELVVGARRDNSFGAVVMAGLGGVWIETLGDVSLRLAPIDESEALSMFDELRALRVLKGSRGRKPVDLRVFAQLVARLSFWFCAAPWLGELDINPIIADGAAFTVVDARIRVRPKEPSACGP